ncbi:MAG: hypothetical protein ABIF89_02415, partial [bacterium]
MTAQFFLKVLIVLLVAGAVFGYYIWDLRRKNINSKTPKILAGILSFVVLASTITGFFIIGTPAEQRQRRFDEQRVVNLQMMQDQIINYWVRKGVLPQNISELENSISGFIVPTDPEVNLAYEYIIIDTLSFELCATFKTSTKDFDSVPQGLRYSYPYDLSQQYWKHEAERTCFTITIDPELYKDNGQLKEPIPVR